MFRSEGTPVVGLVVIAPLVHSQALPRSIVAEGVPAVPSALRERMNQYLNMRSADFAVLVTTGLKKGFSGLAQLEGVLVVSPLGTIPLASLLRGHLIEMLRAKITEQQRAIIDQKLMKHITSPQFKNPIEEIVQLTSQLQEMIKEEAKEHFRVWKKRWQRYQTIHWDGSQIQENLSLVLHGKEPRALSHPKATPLQLPAAPD